MDLSGPNTKKCKELLDRVRRAKSSQSASNNEAPLRNLQHQVRLNDIEVACLCKAYREGATVYELAARFGCHRNSVSKHLKRNGVKMRLQPLSEGQILKAIELYESGLSLTKVSGLLEVCAGTVHARLRERGVIMRDSHGRQLCASYDGVK